MREKNGTDWAKLIWLGFCALLALVIVMSCDQTTGPNEKPITVTHRLMIYSDVASMPTNGGLAHILVKVYSGSDTTSVANNVRVQFTSSLGSIQLQNELTDANGYARAVAYAGQRSGNMGITASIENYSNTIFISVTPGSGLVFANPSEILADGRSQSMISATVIDSLGQPVPGVAVQFVATSGTVTAQSFTDNQGKAAAVLRSIASSTDISATVTATSSVGKIAAVVKEGEQAAKPAAVPSSLGSTTVVFKGITISGSAGKNTVFANSADSTTVSISAKETTSGAAVAGAHLAFTTNLGLLRAKEGVTDASGNASVVLFGSNISGVAVVQASISDQLSFSTEITLTKQLYMTLMSNPSSLAANGSDTAEIKAQISDADGNPVQGEQVFFSTSLGTILPSAQTDLWGFAKVNLRSPRYNGIAEVKAKYRTIEKITRVEFTGAEIKLQAAPMILVANDTNRSTLTVTLTDASGSPVVGTIVTLSTTRGKLYSTDGLSSGTSIVDSTATTGKVSAYLKSSEAGDAVVTVATTGASEKTTVHFTDYTFTVTPSAPETIAGGGKVQITATLRSKDGSITPIELADVTFSTTLGTIQPIERTSEGSVVAELTSGNSAGNATVTATMKTPPISSSIAVPFVAAGADSVVIKSDRMSIRLGGDAVDIRATVYDVTGNTKSGSTVTFTIRKGPGGGEEITPASAVTNDLGLAVVSFKSGSRGSDLDGVEIQARVEDKDSNIIKLTIAGEPYSVLVGFGSTFTSNIDGTYGVSVSAIVSDVNRNKVIDNTIVNFSITRGDVGIIEGQIPTTDGVASTQLIYSPSDAGKEVEVTVSAGGIIDRKTVKLPGKAGTIGDLRVSPKESTILGDGLSVTPLSIYLTGMNAEPLSNMTVYCELLSDSKGLGKVDPSALTGDPSKQDSSPGRANVVFTGAATHDDKIVGIRIFAGDKADTVHVRLKGVTVTASADPTILPPDGQSKSTIRVLVKETTTNIPINSQEVRFGAADGFIGGSSSTDESGVATTTYTAPKDTTITASNPLITTILVSFGNKLEVTIPVTIREIRTQGLELFASPTQIPANGSSTSIVTALLRDNNSNPVVKEVIRFTTDIGTITAVDSTDANGRAEAVLVSDRRNGQAHITAQYKNTTRTIPVDFTGVKLSVSATPENLFAGGTEETTVTSFVKDAAEVAIVGETVNFEWFLNGVRKSGSTVQTDNSGKATVNIAATESGRCLILVSAAGAVDSTYVTFNRMKLTVEGRAADSSPGADTLSVSTGGDSIYVWAQLYDTVNEIYVANSTVEFYTTLGTIGKTAVTNSQGIAATYLKSGNTAGAATVLATTYYQSQRVSKEKQFTFVPSSVVGKVELRVDPDRAAINGGSSALVAVVTDKFGNPISNELVSFRLIQGPGGGEYIHPITATTGVSGVATTYFFAGQVPSSFENVILEAKVGNMASNPAKLTIVGAPETILPGYPTLVDIGKIDNKDGTYTLPVSATVLDINSNFVVDGTTVYFNINPPEGVVLSPVKTKNSVAVSQITYPASSAGRAITLTASAGGKKGEVLIPLPGFNVSYLAVSASPTTIPADGKSTSTITAQIFDVNGSSLYVPDGITVSFSTDGGTLDPVVAKTVGGVATSVLTSDKDAKLVSVTVQSGTIKDVAFLRFEEVGTSVNQVSEIQLSASKSTIEADGTSSSQIIATLRSFDGALIKKPTTVEFQTDIGEITQFILSDTTGTAVARFTSGVVGTARISASVGNVTNFTNVTIIPGKPQSIQLTFDNTTVGVQGSGRNETLMIKANVKDNKNNPVADGVRVKFELVGAHDDAVSLTPEGETKFVSSPVATVNGVSTVSFHSGTRAGAHRIKATVVDSTGAVILPLIASETTQFMVVSGPAFLDTSNLSDPFTNARITVAGGPLNIYAGELGTANSKSTISVLVSDRYNNPVPEGTAVYFTTSGGSIDTKTGFTNPQGMASVTLFAGNPLPTLLNSQLVANPNASLGGPANFMLPMFDFDGDGHENNGIATITAYTQGVDQNGRQVTVWNYVPIVFSEPVAIFTVIPVSTSLPNGTSTSIEVTISDYNGNPLMGGSTIAFTSALGSLSTPSITTTSPGRVTYHVSLTNDLNPLTATPANTVVTAKLTSPNGAFTQSSVPIFMDIK
jgi:hypothetical protein